MGATCALGIDAGSTTCKVVGIDALGALTGWRVAVAHPRVGEQASELLREVRAELGAAQSVPVYATGYGRKLIGEATRAVTEITCHARGVFQQLGTAGTLIDIGGQDTKVISIGPNGRPMDFAMNDKCSAGTGRFLEHTAARLQVPIEEMGARALSVQGEEQISSTCTVFAESEIISLVANGAELDHILRGLHRSLVHRVVALLRGVGLVSPLMLSGGVAFNDAVRTLLAETVGEPVTVPKHPQLMGAYGAALLAHPPAS